MFINELKSFFSFLSGKGVMQYRLGDTLQFKGICHPSVGLQYYLQYDKRAFSCTRTSSYTDPAFSHLEGGDEKEVTYTLTCLKTGRFHIREINCFQENENLLAEHLIRVRN